MIVALKFCALVQRIIFQAYFMGLTLNTHSPGERLDFYSCTCLSTLFSFFLNQIEESLILLPQHIAGFEI